MSSLEEYVINPRKRKRVKHHNRSYLYKTTLDAGELPMGMKALHKLNKKRRKLGQNMIRDNAKKSKHTVRNLDAFYKLSAKGRKKADVIGLDDGVGSLGWRVDQHNKREKGKILKAMRAPRKPKYPISARRRV